MMNSQLAQLETGDPGALRQRASSSGLFREETGPVLPHSSGHRLQIQLPCYIFNISRHSHEVNNACALTSFQKTSDPQEHKASPVLDSTGDGIVLMLYGVWTYLKYKHPCLATKDANSSKTAREGARVNFFFFVRPPFTLTMG